MKKYYKISLVLAVIGAIFTFVELGIHLGNMLIPISCFYFAIVFLCIQLIIKK